MRELHLSVSIRILAAIPRDPFDVATFTIPASELDLVIPTRSANLSCEQSMMF